MSCLIHIDIAKSGVEVLSPNDSLLFLSKILIISSFLSHLMVVYVYLSKVSIYDPLLFNIDILKSILSLKCVRDQINRNYMNHMI